MMNERLPAVLEPLAIMPVMDLQVAAQRRDALGAFVRSILIEGTDYGTIPGTDKDTLLKPGAEKLTTFFGLAVVFGEPITEILDWTGEDHGGEPFFFYQYRCSLYRGDILVGQGIGSCNSWEKKYRFRTGQRICPECGEAAIIKGKEEYGGGWLCWKQKDGCGYKWPDGAGIIEKQQVGKVKNDSPADLVNTLDKMAQKRALVAATLITVNASDYFTQDIEDMDFGSGVIDVTPLSKEPPEPVKAEPSDNGQSNGKPEPKFNGDVAGARAWLEEKGEVVLGIIVDAVLMTGLYDDSEHVRNTLELDEPDMVKLQSQGLGTDFRRKVTNTLLVFDLLMERKEIKADA